MIIMIKQMKVFNNFFINESIDKKVKLERFDSQCVSHHMYIRVVRTKFCINTNFKNHRKMQDHEWLDDYMI